MTKLEILLKKKKMTAYALAKRSGISHAAIWHILKGDWKPRLDTARKISEVLDVRVDDLF